MTKSWTSGKMYKGFSIFKEFRIRGMMKVLCKSWITEITLKILEFCQ